MSNTCHLFSPLFLLHCYSQFATIFQTSNFSVKLLFADVTEVNRILIQCRNILNADSLLKYTSSNYPKKIKYKHYPNIPFLITLPNYLFTKHWVRTKSAGVTNYPHGRCPVTTVPEFFPEKNPTV